MSVQNQSTTEHCYGDGEDRIVQMSQQDSAEETVTSSPSYRLAMVCLGLLCAVLLAVNITLILHCNRGSFGAVEPEVEVEILRDKHDTLILDQLQRDYSTLTATKHQRVNLNLTAAKDQLQGNYLNLIAAKDQLQRDYLNLSASKDQLQRDYENLTAAKNQLQRYYIDLTAAKDQLQRDYISLSESKAILSREYIVTVRERDRLKHTLSELVNYLPVDRHCPVLDSNTHERLCRPCPKGWKLFESKCYYFSMERKSWISSRIECIQQGADLAVIESSEEQEFIHKHTLQHDSPWDGHWVGLMRGAEKEGGWVWVDGTRLNEGYWTVERPSRWNEDCISTLRAANPMESWSSNKCSWKLRWICESRALILSV